jgi:hypothetical protein
VTLSKLNESSQLISLSSNYYQKSDLSTQSLYSLASMPILREIPLIFPKDEVVNEEEVIHKLKFKVKTMQIPGLNDWSKISKLYVRGNPSNNQGVVFLVTTQMEIYFIGKFAGQSVTKLSYCGLMPNNYKWSVVCCFSVEFKFSNFIGKNFKFGM